MLDKRRLVIDTMSETHRLLAPYADEEFWDFASVIPQPGSVYILGRQHLLDNKSLVCDMALSGNYVMIFDNSAEGSWTCETQLKALKIHDLVRSGKLLVITGAPISPELLHIVHEHFLPTSLDYEENITAQGSTAEIFSKIDKPYRFLFLNGRARPHRKYLFERLKRTGQLDHALWTMLDAMPCILRTFELWEDGINIMATASPLQHLPAQYEVATYRNPVFGPIVADRSNIKQELFNREWGDIYIEPAPYVDTYFSLVTETVCAESYLSFRTEKIAKPLVMGHPFIVAANRGFYRDLQALGFRTFGHVIDETFDQIDNPQDRMDRLIQVVVDLCRQDLPGFLRECYDVCKYNQEHLAEFSKAHRQEFPSRFFQFLNAHARS